MVVVLTVIVFFNHLYGTRARNAGTLQDAAAMSKRLGPFLLLLGLAIIVAAVLTFR